MRTIAGRRRAVLAADPAEPAHALADNRLLSWYVGGLNFQIEHHLFPRVCHVHYRQLSPIVQRLAAKHGIPYHSCPTLWQAIRSHYRVLQRLGAPGHEHVPWADPVPG